MIKRVVQFYPADVSARPPDGRGGDGVFLGGNLMLRWGFSLPVELEVWVG